MKFPGILSLFSVLFFYNGFVHAEVERLYLGAIFEQGSDEVQSAFKYAMMTLRALNTTTVLNYELNTYADIINTADAFKLSRIICKQFFRGVYGMVGSMSPESFQTFHSYANTFQMPFVTPWFLIKNSNRSDYDIQQAMGENPALDLTVRPENHSSESSMGGGGRRYSGNGNSYGYSNTITTISSEHLRRNIASERNKTDFATRLRPDLHQPMLDTIAHYGWKNIIYLYYSHEGLLRLQSIFQRLTFTNDSLKVTVVKKIGSSKDALSILRNIEVAQRWSQKYVVLDCPTSLAKDIIISHVRDVHMGRRTYHYLLAGLAFDEPWEGNVVEFGAVNITGFRIVDPNRVRVKEFLNRWSRLDTHPAAFPGAGKNSISANAALMFDSVSILKATFTNILNQNGTGLRRNPNTKFSCDSGSDFLDGIKPFNLGHTINTNLRKVVMEGLTGHIEFHKNGPKVGTRYNFTVDVMEMSISSAKVKIGEWSDITGFSTGAPKHKRMHPIVFNKTDLEKVYIVTSILEEPYLMYKKIEKGEKPLEGNDRFEGFCKDLADMIAESMSIKYRIELVNDGKYGAENTASKGGWDGMVGELIRNDAELAVAPLTITSQRETVVDFSMPFMELGISIMIKKPQIEMPGAFSFVKPMRSSVWFAAFGALLAVAGVLLVVQRKPHNADTYTFRNTLWFSIASVFRQGTPITPRLKLRNDTRGSTELQSNTPFYPSLPYKEADMSMSSLTITAERERVIDFSKPFMNLGISIMVFKPKKASAGVFGFMSPLSNNTWYCVILAYLGVSFVLYLVTRFNPTEWILETHGTVHNQFSIPNALWFSFAALVQQGSDISPRSLAGRLVGSVWWFFTLILISSYTANFAAVRTVNRMILPIKSAKDLSLQNEVSYGTLMGGSTYEFFRRSEVQVYKTMFEFMSGPNQRNVKTYDEGIKLVREKKGKYALLIESPKNDYTNQRKPCDTMKVGPNLDSKGFGVGTPLGSPLKYQINLEVLRMKEKGILSKLENKWWFERSECDNTNKQETTAGDDELSLGSLAGIFYILIIGLVLAMIVSFLEFCYNSKKEAQKSQVSLSEAMKQKARTTIAGPVNQLNTTNPH